MSDFKIFQAFVTQVNTVIQEKSSKIQTVQLGNIAVDIKHDQVPADILLNRYSGFPTGHSMVTLYTTIDEKARIPATLQEIDVSIDANLVETYIINQKVQSSVGWPLAHRRSQENYEFTKYYVVMVKPLYGESKQPIWYYFYYQGEYTKSLLLPYYRVFDIQYRGQEETNYNDQYRFLNALMELFGHSNHPEIKMASRGVVHKYIGDIIGDLICGYAYS